MSNTTEPNDERDLPTESDPDFIPALCDQLDGVYQRYQSAGSVRADADVRVALQQSLDLLTDARGGDLDRSIRRRVDRAVRQAEAMLGNKVAPTDHDGSLDEKDREKGAVAVPTGVNGDGAATEIDEAEAFDEPVGEEDAEAVGEETPEIDESQESEETPEAQPIEEAGAVPVSAAGEAPYPAQKKGRRALVSLVVLVLAAALVVAVVLAVHWRNQSDTNRANLNSTTSRLTITQALLAAAESNLAHDQSELSQANTRVGQLNSQLAAVKGNVRESQTALSKANGKLGQTQSQIASSNATVQGLQSEVAAKDDQIAALQQCASAESTVINTAVQDGVAAAEAAIPNANAICGAG